MQKLGPRRATDLFGRANGRAASPSRSAVVEYSHGQGLRLDRVAALGLTKSERGLFLPPSLRWWPTVALTYDGDSRENERAPRAPGWGQVSSR